MVLHTGELNASSAGTTPVCTLLLQKENDQECSKFVSSEIKNRLDDMQAKGEDEQDPDEVEPEQSIHSILDKMYNNVEGGNNEVSHLAILDATLKEELLRYCDLMKAMDTSGLLENYEMGSADDVFSHIANMLEKNGDYVVSSLSNRMKNTAICLKGPDE
ncbi:hypothetical protein C922_02818 [Plasmodium inui San Antonio 1]|uniref:Uncharacterized protein n=1 Tax=Plasmodium inui San Antonio 1 TaxID=1237626 RepID=W7A6I2_9APIC|nr:hypothetical protein C922_02818 [Plasmodium inui San Antonio 1]EUD66833.1 hypothetical protein C922_02818 [Plasmodium inui San Antonio 1]